MIYSASIFILKWGIWGNALVQLMIFLLPLAYALYIKCDMKKLYSLKWATGRHIIGAVLLWLGGFLFNQVLVTGLSKIFPSMVANSDSLNSTILEAGFVPTLIVVGIMPAIAEEAAFRGFLFGALKNKMKVWLAILLSAALFGAYHMNPLQFFTGLFMGSIMAYMAYKSGSIVPGVIFHMVNNSLSVYLSYYPEVLEAILIIGKAEQGIGDLAILAVAGIVLLIIGLFVFGAFHKSKKPENA